MAKTKSVYFCNNCGYESAKWMGKCPGCNQWNTFTEEKISVSNSGRSKGTLLSGDAKPQRVSEIEALEEPRIHMPSEELNRVLGGGLTIGSLTLVGGEPGIGKSTLILQNILSIRSKTILYISGEESAHQLKQRADRIGKIADNTYILCETVLEKIFVHIEKIKPQLIVIDSIQTIASNEIESAAGSISQVRECAVRLLRYAKESGVPIILVGHINKDGAIAGPKVLEHIVDTVLQFEGDQQYLYRLIRPIKNRFGSTNEIGIYEMVQNGLREVKNPGEMLMRSDHAPMSGIAYGITIEGGRPFLIEVQALVSTAAYGTPQRSVTGFDQRRLNMLLAVLEKRVGFKLAAKDVFLNIAGGLKVSDPAIDMAVVVAILSSNFDMVVSNRVAFAGEVSLSGEIRPSTRMEQRVSEADKLGFEMIYVPKGSLKGLDGKFGLKVVEVQRVDELCRHLFT